MKLVPRKYQLSIYNSVKRNGNTLVVLPTGLGKTLIALMLIRDFIKDGKTSLFLAPTKPLCEQHKNSVMNILGLDESQVALITGSIKKDKRSLEYRKPVVVATPQTVRNDLISGIVDPSLFSLVIFDEAHKAVGDYAYTKIAERTSPFALHLALTASPGGDYSRIREVMNALSIGNVEIRTKKDSDVSDYVHETKVFWRFVSLPPKYKLAKHYLEILIKKHAKKMSSMGIVPPLKSKSAFLSLRKKILGIRSNLKYALLIQHAVLTNLMHMSELLETQSMSALKAYIEDLRNRKTRSASVIFSSPEFMEVEKISSDPEMHPKLLLLKKILGEEEKGKKAIVFAQYRFQVIEIARFLSDNGISAMPFMGKRDGYNKKLQEETIKKFRDGEFSVLVASSVGEEGLDIPSVDLVVFYEPIPSEIRAIQRRGRTGRFGKGRVEILITKNSRDEFYYWAAINREKKMRRMLYSMSGKDNQKRKKSGQYKIDEFT